MGVHPLRVSAVTFDAYGTLFEGGSDDLIGMLRALHADQRLATPFDDLLGRREQLIGELERQPFMTMRARDEWILSTLFRENAIADDAVRRADALYEAYFRVKPYPDAAACLDNLRARGVKLAIVSNADVEMMKRVLDATDFRGAFDAIITSESARAYKPAAAIFLSAARSLGVPASDVLHVGDSFAADVVGAKRAGMQAAWLTRPGGLPAPKKREAKPDFKIETLAKLPSRVAPAP